jgi:hypothetical protein
MFSFFLSFDHILFLFVNHKFLTVKSQDWKSPGRQHRREVIAAAVFYRLSYPERGLEGCRQALAVSPSTGSLIVTEWTGAGRLKMVGGDRLELPTLSV